MSILNTKQCTAIFFTYLTIFVGPAFAEKTIAEKAIEEVIVHAEQQPQTAELGLSLIELSGDELTTKMGATLGDTLANELGVHNASYGPGVGLPVLRGLSGVRIRLSEDGIGAWDASSISPDHATAIEPVLAESIQVIKGPATVLHGNNAVGGTVEVKHGRISEELSGQSFSSIIESRKELENDHERESHVAKFRLELGRVALQIDGFFRDSKDMSIPGIAIQEDAIAEVFGISNSDNTFGTVLNTDSKSHSGSLALSYVGDAFFVGVSSTLLNSEYGIPPGAHTEPADSPGHSHSHPVGQNIVIQSRVRIDLEQDRHLFKIGGTLDKGRLEEYLFTIGNVEYTHLEFEQSPVDGLVTNGTRFFNDVVEAKVELGHSLFHFLNKQHHGKFGIQWTDREFSANSERISGGENYIPISDQKSVGVFNYEQFPFEYASLDFGARYEWIEISQRELTAPLSTDNTQYFHEPITYQTYTLSGAVEIDVFDQHNFTVSLNSVQRAPEIQELLSLGSHLATRSFDIGLLLPDGANRDDPPKPERFHSAETRWEWWSRIGEGTVSLFYTEARDFIYQKRREGGSLFDVATQQLTGACTRLEECIAVFNYTQSDVTLTGYEWQWLFPKFEIFSGDFQIELFEDFVRGKIKDGGDLPRMPPARTGIGLQWNNNFVSADLRYSYVSAQDKPGENETATKSYRLLNASLSYTYPIDGYGDQRILVFLQMKNLLNEDIRKSTSFLRNFTPEPGREISAGLRYQF